MKQVRVFILCLVLLSTVRGEDKYTKCPINTYSEGGINPTCTSCPNDRPVTKNFKTGQTSIDSCVPLKCEPGEYEGVYGSGAIFTSGSQCSGISKITTEAECEAAAAYNSKNNIDKNGGYVGRTSSSGYPPGCYYHSGNNKYIWNGASKSTTKCSNRYKCICKTKTCIN